MFKNSFLPIYLGGVTGIVQVNFLYTIFIIIAIITNSINGTIGDIFTKSNWFIIILFIWMHNFYVMANLSKKIITLAIRMHKTLPMDGMWGKPVLVHRDFHGLNIIKPEDQSISFKVVDWDSWGLGHRGGDLSYCLMMMCKYEFLSFDIIQT